MGCKHPRISEDESWVGLPGTGKSGVEMAITGQERPKPRLSQREYLGIQRASCRYKSLPRPSIVSPGLYSIDGN